MIWGFDSLFIKVLHNLFEMDNERENQLCNLHDTRHAHGQKYHFSFLSNENSVTSL